MTTRHPVTRFAPSPTGELHLGHAYSAMVASHLGDGFVLRIDDIDHTRSRTRFAELILSDLEWLGLEWRGAPVYQQHRLERYAVGLESLRARDLVYACYLTRSELAAVLSAPHAPATDTDSLIDDAETTRRARDGAAPAWRLRTARALECAGAIDWWDARAAKRMPVDMSAHGDVVIARRDIGTSYHLSVVIDDAMDGIELVTRGQDLAQSTHVHRLLQALLDIQPPAYFHHDLVTDAAGVRLAKRDRARSLAEMRDAGMSAEDVVELMPRLPELGEIQFIGQK